MRRRNRSSLKPAPRVRPTLLTFERRDAPAVLTVTDLSDGNAGSLRAEIGLARDGDTITFAAGLSGQITLTSGELAIGRRIAIVGPGAGDLTVSGNNATRVFHVLAGADATISGLTVAHGRVGSTGSANEGAGIFNEGGLIFANGTATANATNFLGLGAGIYNAPAASLTVLGSTVSNNNTQTNGGGGAGIYNAGSLTLADSAVTDNSSAGGTIVGGGGDGAGLWNAGTAAVTASTFSGDRATLGGGIYNTGDLTIDRSRFAQDSGSVADGRYQIASGGGGGLYNRGGRVTVTDCTFAGNNAGPDGGGGIYNAGTLLVTGSTFAGNASSGIFHASTFGGGLATAGTAVVRNSTFVGNLAVGGPGPGQAGTGYGGGISNTGTLTLLGVTLTGNSVASPGFTPLGIGGGVSTASGAVTTLSSTIVAGNLTRGSASDLSGAVDSASSYSLVGTGGSGGLVDGLNHNLVGVIDPGLGTLDYHGGPTQTIPLLPGSPAIGAGDPDLGYSDDQRGFRRGRAPSIGAAEYVPGNAAAFRIRAPASVTAGVPFSVTVTALDAYGNLATGFTGPVVLRSTDPQAPDLGSYDYTATDGGSHTFDVTLFSAPQQQLLALTHAFVGTALLSVQPAAPTQLFLVVPDSAWGGVSAGTPLQVTAYLYDAFGNRATNYAGTVHFASTDAAAELPPDYAFTAADIGSHAFSVTFHTPGSVTLTLTDPLTGLSSRIDLYVV